MRSGTTLWAVISVVVVLGFGATGVALADPTADAPKDQMDAAVKPQMAADPTEPAPATQETKKEETEKKVTKSDALDFGYKGVSDFFNIREAYSNVHKGEWAFEVETDWFTRSNHKRDEVAISQSLKYGFTDDFHVQIDLEEPLGTGGDGAPEAYLTLFQNFWHETDWLPAFGGSAVLRIPSGHGSSNVDGKFTGIFTKTLFPKFRAHFMGYVETANGAPGDEDADLRRNFQWGLGPGFDYQLFDKTLVILNYLHKSSDEEAQHNNNILELGVVQELGKTGPFSHAIKLALDVGLDGQRETPNLGGKVLWEVEW